MSGTARPAVEAAAARAPRLWPGLALLVGAGMLALLLLHPGIDEAWENHPAHFWLVLGAASLSVGLGYAVGVAAQAPAGRAPLPGLARLRLGCRLPRAARPRDAGSAARQERRVRARDAVRACGRGGVRGRLGPAAQARGGRARAALGGAADRGAIGAARRRGRPSRCRGSPPLDGELGAEQLDGWQITLAAVGVVLYSTAAIGYFRLYRRRRAPFLLGVALAFALLAEAMLVIAWARNWRVSWWEWHLLMLIAFVTIAVSARGEWHEERFSPLYLDETLADTREASILFADLQGFTSFSERTPPAQVAAMLNGYFGRLVPLLEGEGGVVHQIIGDAVMVIFNQHGDQPDHAGRAASDGAGVPGGGRPRWRPAIPTGRASAPA